jgi:hypothetical protein
MRLSLFQPSRIIRAKYRSSLMENIQNLQRGEPTVITSEPYCVVVAGDCAELNSTERKASFERFRERLNGVRILTFDEVYKRIEGLLEIFTDSSGISPQKFAVRTESDDLR